MIDGQPFPNLCIYLEFDIFFYIDKALEVMKADKAEKKFFGLDRNIYSLGWVSFFTDASSEMIYPLLPIFLTSVLGVGTTFVGLIEGVAEATASLLKLISGWFSDRLGKRKILVVGGYTLSSFIRPFVAAATAGWHVLFIRFLDRVGKGIRTSPRDALIADSTLEGEHGKAFGFQRAMDHAGAVVGPLIAFFLLTFVTQEYRTIFWLAFFPAIFSLIILIRGVSEKKNLSTKPEAAKIKLTLRPFDRRFKLFLFIIVLFSLGNSSDAFLILKAKDAGIPITLLPILWMVLHLTKSLSATPGGILSDRWGRKRVIISGWLLYSGIYWGFAWTVTPEPIWILFAVYGLFYGLTEGGERALVADLVPSHLRGTAYGLYNFAVGISTLPASILMGLLWEKFSPQAAFSFGATLALISALFLWLSLRAGVKGKA